MGWVEDRKDLLSSVGSIATTAGIPIALVMLYLTLCQISEARRQILETKRALQASNMYSISNDARSLFDDITENLDVYNYINGKDKNPSTETKKKAEILIIKSLRFYAQLFRQHQLDMVDQEFWNLSRGDFCLAMKLDSFQEVWKRITESGQWNKDFIRLGNGCKPAT